MAIMTKSGKPRRNDEHQMQRIFFTCIHANEERFPMLKNVFAIPNGGRRHPKIAKQMKEEGVRPGVWDVCCIAPRNRTSVDILFIEFKAGKNGLTGEQLAFRDRIACPSVIMVVCRSATEAITFVEAFLNITLYGKPKGEYYKP